MVFSIRLLFLFLSLYNDPIEVLGKWFNHWLQWLRRWVLLIFLKRNWCWAADGAIIERNCWGPDGAIVCDMSHKTTAIVCPFLTSQVNAFLRSEGAYRGHHKNMPDWLKNIPDNYTAQLAIMGWFLTLTSKMTGYTIPGVGVPGGAIEQPREVIAQYLSYYETLADAMAVKKNWDKPQYAILKEMYLDLKRMHYSFRVNRFC